jgi:hypothetical protein
MKHLKLTQTIAILLLLSQGAWGQNEFYNNGAQVYVQSTGLIFVQGEVINDDEGVNIGRIFNRGDIQLTGNWTNTSTSNVFQTADPGTTTFLGNNAVQTIGGTTDTYFNNLTLNKPGGVREVRQLRNSLCDGILALNDDFLNTQTFNFLVNNPLPAAITRAGTITPNTYTNATNLGYVTSTPGSTGRLGRATSNLFPGAIYLFPVGTAAKFRPVEIKPTSVGNNAYAVQFVDLPTFSTGLKAPTLASINPNYYHFIERVAAAGSPEDVRIYHDFVSDDICDINTVTLSEWDMAMWADLSPVTSLQNAAPLLSWTEKPGYPGTYPTPWMSNSFALAGLFVSPGVSGCAFPVVLTDLSATPQENSILVDWVAQTQNNNLGWYVERSLNGRDFQDLGFVQGAGTQSTAMDYSFDDQQVMKGVLYYYRLRQLDFNGAVSQSEIVTAMLPGSSFSIGEPYPNPSTGTVNLPISLEDGGKLKLTVTNMLGQSVVKNDYDLQNGFQVLTLDLSRLSKGVYQIEFQLNTQKASKKLVLE